MFMPDFWRDKHVLITGATSGIGRALVDEAIARSARVSAIGRRAALLEQIATQHGDKVACAAADVGDRTALQAAVDTASLELGPVDVLIACAGVYRKTDGAAYDAARAEQVFRTNVIGVSNAVGAVLPTMIQRQAGHLCAVSSLGGLLSLPAAGAYCASKAAVATMMKSLRLDVEPRGIHVTTVYPGFVDTAMITDHERRTQRGIWPAEKAAQRILKAIERRKREDAFPLGLWLEIKLASWLSWPVYRWAMKSVPPMEET